MKPRKSLACKNCIYSELTYSPVLKALVETCTADVNRGEGCKNVRGSRYDMSVQKSSRA